jgi:hypothetical protein
MNLAQAANAKLFGRTSVRRSLTKPGGSLWRQVGQIMWGSSDVWLVPMLHDV